MCLLFVFLGDDTSKTRSIKFFLHASGNVAAKFAYDQVLMLFCFLLILSYSGLLELSQSSQVLVGALRKVPKATWNAKERFSLLHFTSFCRFFV